ncbi:ubiquitin-related domain-containing protein [Amanita rubescens]|nr:ubiquitin-related domain-containing protein [Amanita rubescens]
MSLSTTSLMKRSTSAIAPQPNPNVLFLRHGEHIPVAVIKGESFSGIEEVARQRFNYLPEAQLRFHAKIDDNELVEVNAAVWPHMLKTITSLWIEAEGATHRPTCNCSHSKAQSEPLIRIFVITWIGWTIGIRINPGATVGTLKAMIQSKKRIPPDQQRLRFHKDDMDDDETLESYNVGEDSGVVLLLKNGASHDIDHEEEADSGSEESK